MSSTYLRFSPFLFCAITLSAMMFSHETFAQRDSLNKALSTLTNTEPGTFIVHKNQAIDSLDTKSRGKQELRGYRIQIFLGGMADAKNTRTKFMGQGTGLNAYFVQNTPDYAVRVGDFLTHYEASAYLEELKRIYPGAFVVADKIQSPKLIPPVDETGMSK